MNTQNLAQAAVRRGVSLTGPGGYLRVGMTARIPAWSDWFMRGETHAKIVKIGRKYAHVKGVRSGKTWKVDLHLFIDPNGYDAFNSGTLGLGQEG